MHTKKGYRTTGPKDKRTKGQNYYRNKGQKLKRANILKDKRRKKDKGTNKNAKMYKLACGTRGWIDMSSKGQLSEK